MQCYQWPALDNVVALRFAVAGGPSLPRGFAPLGAGSLASRLSDAIAAYRQLGPTPCPIGPNRPPLTTGHNLDWLSQPEYDERASPARRSRSHRGRTQTEQVLGGTEKNVTGP